MNYRLRKNYTKDPNFVLQEILKDRGVENIEYFLHPTNQCELNPYDLDNIELAAKKLLEHLHKNSRILLIVD